MRKMIIKISIRGLRFKIYYLNKYIILIFYIKEVFLDFNDTCAFAEITRKIYIIDNFKINIFIDIDIFTSKRIIINFVIQFIKISYYRNIFILINSRTRINFIKRIVKLLFRIILLSRIVIFITIIYIEEFSLNRNLLFEPQYLFLLKYVDGVYVYIINILFRII